MLTEFLGLSAAVKRRVVCKYHPDVAVLLDDAGCILFQRG